MKKLVVLFTFVAASAMADDVTGYILDAKCAAGQGAKAASDSQLKPATRIARISPTLCRLRVAINKLVIGTQNIRRVAEIRGKTISSARGGSILVISQLAGG